jgi:uncharacterized protein (TIGR00106 family)
VPHLTARDGREGDALRNTLRCFHSRETRGIRGRHTADPGRPRTPGRYSLTTNSGCGEVTSYSQVTAQLNLPPALVTVIVPLPSIVDSEHSTVTKPDETTDFAPGMVASRFGFALSPSLLAGSLVPMATADLTVIGLGRSEVSASPYIAEIQRRLAAQDRVRYRLHAMGTSLEGSAADILALVGELHAVPFELGLPRVYTVLKLDERRDRPDQTLEDKVRAVEELL